jgi:cytochrome c oxidase assembly protein subunit 15
LPSRALHRFAVLTAAATWVLIWAGGLVTSTGSGLAVPDWPLSYGMWMPPMVGGILYEHSHRMIAALVGLLTTVLAVWLWRVEPRRFMRRMGLLALAMVITQGLLGGITVIFLLPTAVSVAHATLAQTFLCPTVFIAYATSREWMEAKAEPAGAYPSLRGVAAMVTGAVYLQLILGAVMRHTGAGLAIPDFPLAFGGLVPPLDDPGVAIHFAHRTGAVAVALLVGWLVMHVRREHDNDRRFNALASGLALLVLLQTLLGGTVVWTAKAVWVTTAHVATGALILALAWLATLRAYVHITARAREARAVATTTGFS